MITDRDIIKLKTIFATKEDLKLFATKDDLKVFATKAEMLDIVGNVIKELMDRMLDSENKILREIRVMREELNLTTVRISKLESSVKN